MDMDLNFCCLDNKSDYSDDYFNADGYGKQETAEILETITLPERTKKNTIPKGKNTSRTFKKGDRIFGEDIDGKYFRFRIFGGVADYRYYFIPKGKFKTIGTKKEYRKEILGTVGSRVFRRVKGGLLANVRNAFLLCVELNVFNFAYKFGKVKEANKKIYEEKILGKWYKMGGRKEALDKAVERGKKKNAIFGKPLRKLQKGIDGEYYLSFTGVEEALAAAAEAAPASASFWTVLGQIATTIGQIGGVVGTTAGIVKTLTKKGEGEDETKQIASEQSSEIIDTLDADETTKALMKADLKSGMSIDEVFDKYGIDTGRDSAIGTWGWVAIIGGSAIALATILYFALRKK